MIFLIIKVVGVSPDSIKDVIQAAITRAPRSDYQLKCFEIYTRGAR